MEEKKNNALEKAENIANGNVQNQNLNNGHAKRRRHKRRVKKYIDKTAPSAKEVIREQKRRDKQKRKAERERELAEKRVELARIKAHKKAEKQKAKAAAMRERNRRKLQVKERKMQLKAERQARKEMLKNESKAERQRRIAMERQVVRDERNARLKAKAERRRQILAAKQAKRTERNNNSGVGGWIAAVVSLGVATLVLASVLTFTYLMPTATDNMLEATYRKSFYDTVAQVDNIDLNLSKVLATKDSGAMQRYLVDTAINSELAENDLQQLPLHDESKFYTTKLINQIGDYAKYLNNKLIAGQGLSAEDRQGLDQLYQANKTLKQSLQNTVDKMANDYNFSAMLDGGSGDVVISNFNELQNLSVQYPELIYDGPFSDGQTQREVKGLKGSQINMEQAKEQFIKVFEGYKLENITGVGEANGDIVCYNVQAEVDGNVLFAQISKSGGKLVMFSYAGSCENVLCDDEEAVEKAMDFMAKTGIENMKAVWINLANNVYTINFASEQNGVIIYSDLVKVRVCAQTKQVIGMEAKSYYMNHTDRVIASPKLTEKQARSKVFDNIEVDSVRLAVVPIGTKSEKLCYEISGEYDGSTYYVYIDAQTGAQIEMFKVLEGTEGTLLM